MNTLKITSLALLIALSCSSFSAVAKDRKAKSNREAADQNRVSPTPAEPAGAAPTASPYAITTAEKRIIHNYIEQSAVSTPRGRSSFKLPPTIAPEVTRADMPPNWDKRLKRGEVLPDVVLQQSQPLPRELTAKLPTGPKGSTMVGVDGKVLRLMAASHEILDVFDLSK